LGSEIDIERYRASVSRLQKIFSDINETANRVSMYRCPYKNAQDLCTANFGCRNQSKTHSISVLPKCTGSDDLDYRSAWRV
jgi:hypothetical protein